MLIHAKQVDLVSFLADENGVESFNLRLSHQSVLDSNLFLRDGYYPLYTPIQIKLLVPTKRLF